MKCWMGLLWCNKRQKTTISWWSFNANG